MAKLNDDSIRDAVPLDGAEATKELKPNPVPPEPDIVGETFSVDGETEVMEFHMDEPTDEEMDQAFEPSDTVYGAVQPATVNVNPPAINIPAPVVDVKVDVPEAQIMKDDERHIRDKYRIAFIAIAVVVVLVIVGLFAINAANASESAARADRDAATQQYQKDLADTGDKYSQDLAERDAKAAEDKAAADAAAAEAQAQYEADVAERDAELDAIKSAHTHDWTIVMKTINHDEVSHTVDHPAVYKDVTTEHSICNECGEVIDGKAAQHIAETGHSGYSRNVPLTEKVLVTEAWVETVVDAEAWVENVADHMVCTTCGEVKPLDDSMKSQG